MKKLIPEELFILASAKIEPSTEEIEKLNNLVPQIKKWDYMLKLAIENGMAPLAYKKIPLLSNGSMIPERVKEKLYQTYLKTFSRNMVLYEHFKLIVTAFNKANIDVIPLKGIYLAEFLYKDIGLRQLSDIDLLVREEDGGRALKILEGLNYEKGLSLGDMIGEVRKCHHYTPMVKQGVSVEIHTRLHRESETYQVNHNSLWDSASSTELFGVKVKVFDIHYLLIHQCLHLEKHFRTGKIQLNGFVDITNIVERFEGEIDWGRVRSVCEEFNCVDNLLRIVNLCSGFFNCRFPKRLFEIFSILNVKKDKMHLVKLIKNPDSMSSGMQNFKVISGDSTIKRRLTYIFPPIEFMVARYNIRFKPLLPLFYIYRIGVGVRLIFDLVVKR